MTTPRRLEPQDGFAWFAAALALVSRQPKRFIVPALLPPVGSATLLWLPVWEVTLPIPGPWVALVSAGICYGIPLCLGVTLACAVARAADRELEISPAKILNPASLGLMGKASMFLFALLIQGYLALFIVENLTTPRASGAAGFSGGVDAGPLFGISDTILATQFGMTGGLLLITQVLFAFFAVPLFLFREVPLYDAWRLSFRAIQLNPWIPLLLGLPGLAMMLASNAEVLSVPLQVLALPLPPLLGGLLFIAWRDLYGGDPDARSADEERMAI